MRRSMIGIGIGSALLIVLVVARSLNNLEKELASLRLQIQSEQSRPQGSQGPRGRQGPQGRQGSPGKEGDPAAPPKPAFDRLSFSSGQLEFQASSGDAAARIAANPDGGGSFQVLNRDGKDVAYLGTTKDGHGLLELDHGKEGPALTLLGDTERGATAEFHNAKGKRSLWLGSFRDSGIISIYGTEKIASELAAGNGGHAWFYNRHGEGVAYVGSSNNQNGSGMLRLLSADKKLAVDMAADTGGYAWFSNRSGRRVAYFGSSNEERGTGMIQLLNASDKLVVDMHSGGGGGYAKFFNSSGHEIVHIGADTAGHGSLFINGTRALDYAEVFELATRKNVVPGTVMAVAANSSITLSPTASPYERRVVGVISGAGKLRPGTVIGSRKDGSSDLPIAVSGQVYVRVCSEEGSIEAGDLLVSSSRPGVAMRALNAKSSVGAVIGKALESFNQADAQEGLIRMLVMLR